MTVRRAWSHMDKAVKKRVIGVMLLGDPASWGDVSGLDELKSTGRLYSYRFPLDLVHLSVPVVTPGHFGYFIHLRMLVNWMAQRIRDEVPGSGSLPIPEIGGEGQGVIGGIGSGLNGEFSGYVFRTKWTDFDRLKVDVFLFRAR